MHGHNQHSERVGIGIPLMVVGASQMTSIVSFSIEEAQFRGLPYR